eukprot:3235822-Rhodomonas_salina.2
MGRHSYPRVLRTGYPFRLSGTPQWYYEILFLSTGPNPMHTPACTPYKRLPLLLVLVAVNGSTMPGPRNSQLCRHPRARGYPGTRVPGGASCPDLWIPGTGTRVPPGTRVYPGNSACLGRLSDGRQSNDWGFGVLEFSTRVPNIGIGTRVPG